MENNPRPLVGLVKDTMCGLYVVVRLLGIKIEDVYAWYLMFLGTLHNSKDVIGFVGLGHMGSRMCQNLVNDGRKILVYDIDNAKKESVVSTIQSSVSNKDMVNGVDSVQELGSKCNIVITMLPNDNIVRMTNNALMEGLQQSQNDNITTR